MTEEEYQEIVTLSKLTFEELATRQIESLLERDLLSVQVYQLATALKHRLEPK